MNLYSKKKMTLFFVLCAAIYCSATQAREGMRVSENLDVMVDFAYPVSKIQSVRQSLVQALYFSEATDNQESVAGMLEDALLQLRSSRVVQSDDRDFIQEMIDKINSLIESLESATDRSILCDLCQQIQNEL